LICGWEDQFLYQWSLIIVSLAVSAAADAAADSVKC
jgi:hypothetical protein